MGLDTTIQIIIVSALMHDIGKFAQRAERPCSAALETTYCPVNSKGISTHKHVLYTDWFIESDDFPLPSELLDFRSKIAGLASAHHKPGVSADKDDIMAEYIIQKADCLSSGLDRISDKENSNFKKAHLKSVFSEIRLEHEENLEYYHGLKAMGSPEALFPCKEKENKTGDYAALFGGFVNALKKVPVDQGFQAYLSSLISVLEKYTYCIPSSTYGTTPDISLYDHSVTTAAIAQALWCGYKREKAELSKQSFLLFSAEFSGIQKYIFSGSAATGYAKTLRARSFHLQVLTRAIILHALDTVDLSPAAKIMDAGVKFILLLPDIQEVREKMQEIMQETEIFFAENFSGELKIPMALISVSQEEMPQNCFLKKLDELNDTLETNKFKPFRHYFKTHSPIFGFDYQKGVCSYCERKQADGLFEGNPICGECEKLIEIGKALTKSEYGIFTKTPPEDFPYIKLVGGIYLALDNGNPFRINEIKQALDCVALKSGGKYTNYPIAGYIPQDEKNENMSFEALAKSAVLENESGKCCVPMLGVLKADVDNLGFIFSLGFRDKKKEGVSEREDKLSVSRFALLSRMLNAFFSEHLVQVIKENRFNIYTVFMGGDDLFVLGSWTDILKFAEILHNDFKRFTAENPDITLSAGITFSNPKLPVSKITEMAENALEESKNYDKNGQTKNACTVFGIPCSWAEFEKQYKNGQWLEEKILENKISQGFVRRLLSYADECKRFSEYGEIRCGLYVSHLQYDIARNITDKTDPDREIRNKVFSVTQAQEFENARVAISYALYKTRKVQGEIYE